MGMADILDKGKGVELLGLKSVEFTFTSEKQMQYSKDFIIKRYFLL